MFVCAGSDSRSDKDHQRHNLAEPSVPGVSTADVAPGSASGGQPGVSVGPRRSADRRRAWRTTGRPGGDGRENTEVDIPL